MNTPWNALFSSFQVYKAALKRRGESQMPQISSGINWLPMSDATAQLIDFENRVALSYRHYTAPMGLASTCQAIKRYENLLAGYSNNRAGIQVSQTCGSAQAIACAMAVLLNGKASSAVLMVGRCYPIFYHHAALNRCRAVQVESDHSDLPDVEFLVQNILIEKPPIVIISIPANPSGACYSVDELNSVLSALDSTNSTLVVDKVGMLVGDSQLAAVLNKCLLRWITRGRVVLIDSLSKSESMAGYRLAHIVANSEFMDRYVLSQQNAIMNPPTVLALTIPLIYLSRAAAIDRESPVDLYASKFVRYLSPSLSMVDSHVKEAVIDHLGTIDIQQFISGYKEHHNAQYAIVLNNRKYAMEKLGAYINAMSTPSAGMNSWIELEPFKGQDELKVQQVLAHEYGVFILTERCFSVTHLPGKRTNFIIRFSTAMDAETFQRGVDRLLSYIKQHARPQTNQTSMSFNPMETTCFSNRM